MPFVVLPLSLCALTACSCLIMLAVSILLKNALRSWITGSTSVLVLEIDTARCLVEATAARGGIQIPGSSCVPMAWPRSCRALWGLLGRGQVFVRGFSSFFCAVHGVFGEPWSYKFEAGCFARLRSEWCLFFFCSQVQFFFFHLSTAEVASLSVGRLAHLIVAAVSSAADSIDMFLVDGVCSSSLVMLFLARLLCSVFGCHFRVVLGLIDYFSVLIGVTSGVSIDLSSTESVFEVLVSARVLLARFTLVIFVF